MSAVQSVIRNKDSTPLNFVISQVYIHQSIEVLLRILITHEITDVSLVVTRVPRLVTTLLERQTKSS